MLGKCLSKVSRMWPAKPSTGWNPSIHYRQH